MHLIHVYVHICIRRRRRRRREANGEEYEHEEMVITHYLRITNHTITPTHEQWGIPPAKHSSENAYILHVL